MPREVVKCRDDEVFVAKVGWANGQHVQVGVAGDDGQSLNWLLHGDRAEQVGEAVLQVVKGIAAAVATNVPGPAYHRAVGDGVLNALDASGGSYDGVWTTLDREGCNRLIRLLRRARDAAYGADA